MNKQENRNSIAREKWQSKLEIAMAAQGLKWPSPLVLVVFKHEKILETYLQNEEGYWTLFRTQEICAASGELGRKLEEGDRQVPEGFYEVKVLNPKSKFHLSLGLNYPNEADMVVADKNRPGGDIYIHGGCASVGCCALTDEGIEPIYVMCEAAQAAGMASTKVMILPCRFDQTNLDWKAPRFMHAKDFWPGLRQGYLWFKTNRLWPNMVSDSYGNYILESDR